MIPVDPGLYLHNTAGVLIDTNLLVLFVVGTVNRERIRTFKRTSIYTREDYDLLRRVLSRFKVWYTVAHVLAEVNDLTDLPGPEKIRARLVLKDTISPLHEADIPSARAAEERIFEGLGLVDAAIGAAAREHNCSVLTDDFDLYHRLSRDHIYVFNFTHLREASWRL